MQLREKDERKSRLWPVNCIFFLTYPLTNRGIKFSMIISWISLVFHRSICPENCYRGWSGFFIKLLQVKICLNPLDAVCWSRTRYVRVLSAIPHFHSLCHVVRPSCATKRMFRFVLTGRLPFHDLSHPRTHILHIHATATKLPINFNGCHTNDYSLLLLWRHRHL